VAIGDGAEGLFGVVAGACAGSEAAEGIPAAGEGEEQEGEEQPLAPNAEWRDLGGAERRQVGVRTEE
jgi:hypothetical protein